MTRFLDLPDSTILIVCYYILRLDNLRDIVQLYSSCKQLKVLLHEFFLQFINENASSIINHGHAASLKSLYILFTPKLFLLGGMVTNRKCHIFHPSCGRFSRGIAGTGLKRADEFDVVNYRGIIVAISGSDDSAVGKVEAYHAESNTWFLWPSLPKALTAISCAVIPDGPIVVSGGTDRADMKRSQELYFLRHPGRLDFSQRGVQAFVGSWEKHESALLKGRSHHSSIVFQNALWIAGGLVSGRMVATNTVETVDIVTGVASPAPPMLRHRFLPKLLIVDNQLFAVGGDVEGVSLSVCSIERFDASKQQWMFVTFFPQPRRRVRCSISASGNRIFVFGGSDGAFVLSSWDFFDVRGKYWASQIRSMINEDPESLSHFNISNEELCFIRQLNLDTIPHQPDGIKSAAAVYFALR